MACNGVQIFSTSTSFSVMEKKNMYKVHKSLLHCGERFRRGVALGSINVCKIQKAVVYTEK